MSEPRIDLSAKVELPYKFHIDTLERFVRVAKEQGLTSVTWTANGGRDQHDPSVLRLKAEP
jgi:hypothetical protein